MSGNKSAPKTYYIIGADGFVGGDLYRTLQTRGASVVGTYFAQAVPGLQPCDITQPADCTRVLGQARAGDTVIHAAAEAHVDRCEIDATTDRVNQDGTRHLVEALPDSATRFVFISSEYVFDGKQGPYSESDSPNPLSRYARQKLWSERFVQAHRPQHTIARTTTVFGHETAQKNFLMSLRQRLTAGEKVKVPEDQISTPTYVEDLVSGLLAAADQSFNGILHLAGPERMSRVAFAYKIAEVFALDQTLIEPVSTQALKQAAPRPLSAGLKIDLAQEKLSWQPRTVVSALHYIHDHFG